MCVVVVVVVVVVRACVRACVCCCCCCCCFIWGGGWGRGPLDVSVGVLTENQMPRQSQRRFRAEH